MISDATPNENGISYNTIVSDVDLTCSRLEDYWQHPVEEQLIRLNGITRLQRWGERWQNSLYHSNTSTYKRIVFQLVSSSNVVRSRRTPCCLLYSIDDPVQNYRCPRSSGLAFQSRHRFSYRCVLLLLLL